MERRAVDAEREVDAMKKAEFMVDKVGETYDGIISSVTKFGIFVELPNTIEGLIHVNNLKQDYFHFIENHMALVGERTGMTLKIGQKVQIRVEKADPETREVDFELISAEEVAPVEGPKGRKKAKPILQLVQIINEEIKKMNHLMVRKRKIKKKGKGKKQPFYKEAMKQKKKKGKKKK